MFFFRTDILYYSHDELQFSMVIFQAFEESLSELVKFHSVVKIQKFREKRKNLLTIQKNLQETSTAHYISAC